MKLRKFQEGGQMVAEAPAEEAQVANEQDAVMQQLAQLAQQLVDMLMQQVGDPQAVAAVLQMALEMLTGGMQGQQQPVFKKGGKLVRR